MFGVMANLWKLFFYSPKKAEELKEVQSVLGLPELKIVKPSSTRWLSHECCMKAIRKELPALILTLQDLYETSKHLVENSFIFWRSSCSYITWRNFEPFSKSQLFYAEVNC